LHQSVIITTKNYYGFCCFVPMQCVKKFSEISFKEVKERRIYYSNA